MSAMNALKNVFGRLKGGGPPAPPASLPPLPPVNLYSEPEPTQSEVRRAALFSVSRSP